MRFPVESTPQILGALFAALLALVLLRVGRRRAATLALALLLANSALSRAAFVLSSAQTETYPHSVLFVIGQAFGSMDGFLVACFGAMLLAERTPVPRALRSFATYLLPAFALFTLTLLRPDLVYDTTAFVSQPLVEDAGPGTAPWENPRLLILVDRASDLAWTLVPLLLVRWGHAKETGASWASMAAIAVAMVSVFAFYAASDVIWASFGGSAPWMREWTRGLVLANLVLQAALVAYLVILGARTRARRPMAWGGALVIVALWSTGIFLWSVRVDPVGLEAARSAIIAIPFPLIASYALLRHQLLGLDVKLRFAISKSTIAAAFIAVFFVASEAAQQFFGATFNSAYVGIVAAGALVFAIAPLQRAAERLAERAVPREDAAPPADPTTTSREEAYRRAVRVALRDRRMTREEERHLLDVAHHLSIPPSVAGRIHDETEREVLADDAEHHGDAEARP